MGNYGNEYWRIRVREVSSVYEVELKGKISLGEHWLFVLDPGGPNNSSTTVLFASPAESVVSVVNTSADIEEFSEVALGSSGSDDL